MPTKRIVIIILIISALTLLRSNDFSQQLEGYTIFRVPLTQKLASSLADCSYYKRTFRPPLGQKIWTNNYNDYTILIKKKNSDLCRVEFKDYNTIVKTEIPMPLAKKAGEILQLEFSNNSSKEIKNFSRCIVGFHLSEFEETNHYISESFLHEIEDYFKLFDITDKGRPMPPPYGAYEEDSQACQDLLIYQSLLVKDPEFLKLKHHNQSNMMAGHDIPYNSPFGERKFNYYPRYDKSDYQKGKWMTEYRTSRSICKVINYADGGGENFYIPLLKNDENSIVRQCW